MLNEIDKEFLYRLEIEIQTFLATGEKGKILRERFSEITREAAEELKVTVWRSLRTMTELSRRQMQDAALPILKGFTRMLEETEADVLDLIRTAKTTDEAEKNIKRRLEDYERYARTWTFTGQGAINQAERINTALKRGYTHFTLTGPAPEREWCREHIDKTFSYEEIVKMDNGQRLPVLFYRGGYNCRHIWLPVRDK